MATEPALDMGSGEFLASYIGNRQTANETVLESSSVAASIQRLIDGGGFEGTASDLLERLNQGVDDRTERLHEKDKSWPKSPRALTNALRRLAPNLRIAGLDIQFWRESSGKRRRIIAMRKGSESCGPCVSDPQQSGENSNSDET